MSRSARYTIRQVTPDDVPLIEGLLDVFGEAFEEEETYNRNRPDELYIRDLLGHDYIITFVALRDEVVVGGLVAYELRKFEQPRCEIYIYDLAVAIQHRREGIATGLINATRQIGQARGAHVVFIQADVGDDPAIELYTKLGVREDVLHFDMIVETQDAAE